MVAKNKRRRRRGSRHVTFGDGEGPEREKHVDLVTLKKRMAEIAMDETRFGDTESVEEVEKDEVTGGYGDLGVSFCSWSFLHCRLLHG